MKRLELEGRLYYGYGNLIWKPTNTELRYEVWEKIVGKLRNSNLGAWRSIGKKIEEETIEKERR